MLEGFNLDENEIRYLKGLVEKDLREKLGDNMTPKEWFEKYPEEVHLLSDMYNYLELPGSISKGPHNVALQVLVRSEEEEQGPITFEYEIE